MDTVVINAKEEYAYGYIINALAGGLYPDKFHVIREYIQNGYDAIINWKKISKDKTSSIKVVLNKPSIIRPCPLNSSELN